MRIPIREQLAGLILISALVGLAVVSLATWFTNYNYVLGVRAGRLAYTAALKAGQLSSNLAIMTTAVDFVASRVLIQNALQRYNNGNSSSSNWNSATADLNAAIGSSRSVGQAILLQAMVYPRDGSGANGTQALVNVTESSAFGQIALPYRYRNGSTVYLGDRDLGYPPNLYPNLTYSNGKAYSRDTELNATTPNLVLGPWWVNDTFALASITTTVINNTSITDVLGYLTVVMDAVLVASVVQSHEGLDDTGELLIVTPSNVTNRLPQGYTAGTSADNNLEVQYIALMPQDGARHPNHIAGSANPPFAAGSFPAIVEAFAEPATSDDTTSSGSLLSTYNEHGDQVSVGFATVTSDMVDWIVLVEQQTYEVWQPIDQLRNVLLACVFGTVGFLLLIAFPLAHFSVLPIRRLREATRRSIAPPTGSRSSLGSYLTDAQQDGSGDVADDEAVIMARKEGLATRVRKWRHWRNRPSETRGEARRKRDFRIPGKVKERKQVFKDELWDLTTTFNEMSDELVLQYSKLEERVQQRTAELELSKKAAEVANESKTLFIANISHELKTPLNGILGMCAVCMQEDDPIKLKRELGVIYRSGDLLLNLLNDLLQFTRNQVGQNISLEEREFRLRDVSSQILAIFDKQAKDGQIKLRVEFHETNGTVNEGSTSDADAPPENVVVTSPLIGRLKDQILWGDVHRILQVIINLVNNSLKFTPAGGSVTLRIKRLVDTPSELNSRHPSISSTRSKRKTSRRHDSSSTVAVGRKQESRQSSLFGGNESMSAPPPNSKYVYLAFEVQDTGPGIPPDQQRKIFEPFVQGDLGLTKKYGGTGLGLSICQQLATLMHGVIGVESTLGVGSMFFMKIPLRSLGARKDSNASSALAGADDRSMHSGTLLAPEHTSGRVSESDDRNGEARSNVSDSPAVGTPQTENSQPRLVGLSQPFFATNKALDTRDTQAAAIEQIEKEVARSGKIRVLVAEDNKVNQEVVLRMLKLEDIYDVTVASDGQVALDLVRENMAQGKPAFNLIFMDIQMPNVDGIQSTKLIREMGYEAPIVALTAFAEESNIKNCLDSGMNYFLSKPIRRPQLKKVLKEYCAPIMEENEDVTPSPEETTSTKAPVTNGNEKKSTVVVTTLSASPSSEEATSSTVA